MTGMLASVNCLDEALRVLGENVDIIDLKQPETGSLGGLPIKVVNEVVSTIAGRCLTSATIGDLPMQPEIIHSATLAMAETGVDYVKIGIYPDGDVASVLQVLKPVTSTQKLIAVLFADEFRGLPAINEIKAAGFSGVMLDTLDKTRGSLPRLWAVPQIGEFVEAAKSVSLLCGLAGSLREEDVPLLLTLAPDYLGFRGGLCEMYQRTGRIDASVVRRIRRAMS